MMHDDRDESLRRAFQELREQDRSAAPPFARLADRSPTTVGRRRTGGRWRALGLAATGLGLILLAGLLALARRAPAPRSGESVATIAAWRSPTETLLRTPGRELSRDLPRLGGVGEPWLGGAPPRPTSDSVAPLTTRKEAIP